MSDLATTLELINYAFVLFFGVVVSLYLADINFMDYKSLYIFTLLGFGVAQGIFYLLMGESLLYRCYPLLIHLPLVLLIWLVFHRNFYVAAIAVFYFSSFYLCFHLIFPIRKTKRNEKTCFSPLQPRRHRKKLNSYPFPRNRQPFTGMTFGII